MNKINSLILLVALIMTACSSNGIYRDKIDRLEESLRSESVRDYNKGFHWGCLMAAEKIFDFYEAVMPLGIDPGKMLEFSYDYIKCGTDGKIRHGKL